MKSSLYFRDKIFAIFINIISIILIFLLLVAFKTQIELSIVIIVIIISTNLLNLFNDYNKRKQYYINLIKDLDNLDKKYLISEIIKKPEFYDGKILYDVVDEIDRSFNEKLKEYEYNLIDFKDFIEMWIHEVKIPLSGIYLILHNSKKIDNKLLLQVHKLEEQIEQILYYVRSENAEDDYLIKKISLNDIIKNVALKNKEYFLGNDVSLITDNCNVDVLTDSKWLEFILNQLINNSIKYKRNNVDSYIKINAYKEKGNVKLVTEDNGIGITKSDINKVFNKSFTGTNGRKIASSTGMGLYIVKKLCDKLGHIISIESVENEYTKVIIIINNSSIYDCLK